MIAVIQRVSEASVTIEGKVEGKIDAGFLILLGITHEDTQRRYRMAWEENNWNANFW